MVMVILVVSLAGQSFWILSDTLQMLGSFTRRAEKTSEWWIAGPNCFLETLVLEIIGGFFEGI